MLVRMTETKRTAVDSVGIRVEELRAGETYDLPDVVADRLIGRGAATAAHDRSVPAVSGTADPDGHPPQTRRRSRSSSKPKPASQE